MPLRADKNVDTLVGLVLNYDQALFGFLALLSFLYDPAHLFILAVVKERASIFSHDLGGKKEAIFLRLCSYIHVIKHTVYYFSGVNSCCAGWSNVAN